jgi:hypothetical protein
MGRVCSLGGVTLAITPQARTPQTDALDAPVLAEVQDELFRGSVRATHVDAGGEKLSAAGYLGVEWNR